MHLDAFVRGKEEKQMIVKITKEQYDEIMAADDRFRKAYDLGIIDAADYYGYGIRDFSLTPTPEGATLEYSTYDCCD
jgi:hypothetical protein